ncbi:MAG: PAS domain-containing protein [Deltaproteobacteria bacterium]|nr:PAS domain-containing protein [Deltaproteobacteria bacterium]MBW2069846.1 PAS domain-containing protein [Deltaproteobacteria bacterium]
MTDKDGSKKSQQEVSAEDQSNSTATYALQSKRNSGINIAIIGGGTRCRSLLEMFAADRFKHLKAQVVAVADINPDAPGLLLAQQRGIFTTTDYHDFFSLDDLDLVIELTGNEALLEDVLKQKPPQVRVLDYAISRLLSDIVTFAAECQEQKRDLHYYQSMVQTMFVGIKEPMLWLKPNYEIADANEPMLAMVGMPREEVIGKTCHEVIHHSLEPCHQRNRSCPMLETLQTGLSAHAIHEHMDREHNPRLMETSAYPLRNHLGEVTMVVEFFRDITSDFQKRLEIKAEQIKKDIARLVHEDKMIALGKLVASSVHEINNPISGIHTLARLMLRTLEEGPPQGETLVEMQRYLELIANESDRCGQIVSNLLSFSRLKKMERCRVNINEIIRSVILLSRHRMELQNIVIEEKLADGLPDILGDQNQIQQCLMNLVFNGMEAMPEGGKLTITTSYDKKTGRVRIAVSDTGCGIPQENISAIFEPFYSTKSEDKGVGLGLSVVYGIVREHKGSVYVDSTVGKGSTFILRFPAAAAG